MELVIAIVHWIFYFFKRLWLVKYIICHASLFYSLNQVLEKDVVKLTIKIDLRAYNSRIRDYIILLNSFSP